MDPSSMPPQIRLAVAIIMHRGQVLLIWNPRWGSYTLPMTKIREWYSSKGHVDTDSESSRMAAIRGAAEGLGRPLRTAELPDSAPLELGLQPYGHRSQRDGKWKRYARDVYLFRLDQSTEQPRVANQHWIDPSEIDEYHPVSPTATEILAAALAGEYLQ